MWRAAGWGELLSQDPFAQGGGEGLSASVSPDSHPYELYLQLNEIQHKRTRVVPPQTNGFVERFHRTVLEEFFRPVFHTGFYERVAALQSDLDVWLVEYNTQRPPPKRLEKSLSSGILWMMRVNGEIVRNTHQRSIEPSLFKKIKYPIPIKLVAF